jgi:hypothetical protein
MGGILLLATLLSPLAGPGHCGTKGRAVPFKVVYDFHPDSEVKDPQAVKVKSLRVLMMEGHPVYGIGAVGKGPQPISLNGEVTFYDAAGKVVATTGKDLDGNNHTAVSEIATQVGPGYSEAFHSIPGIAAKDLKRIKRATITIRAAEQDSDSRD